MIIRTTARHLVLTGLALTPLWASVPALAAGTAANTTISNTATVNYSVAGTAQPQIGSSPTGNTSGAGTPTTFLVDNKVNLSLIETDGKAASTAAGQLASALVAGSPVAVYKLTNIGNSPQGYIFGVTQPGPDGFFVPATTFTLANTKAIVSSAACSTATTVTPTFNNEVATSVLTLAADSCLYVMVVGDTPAAAATGAGAVVRLTATTTVNNTATPLVATLVTQADTANAVDILFADGTVNGHVANVARDAIAFDDDEYVVTASALTVTKTSAVISDPTSGITNPKAIPGALMEYTVTVTNAAGSATATNVVIADNIPANTTYAAGTITLNGVAVADGPVGGVGFTPAPAPGSVSVTVASLAPTITTAATATLKFRVTIN